MSLEQAREAHAKAWKRYTAECSRIDEEASRLKFAAYQDVVAANEAIGKELRMPIHPNRPGGGRPKHG